jgi:hypothetical protein
MDAILKCPKCNADIPLTDAFRREIEWEVLAEERERHAKDLDDVRTAAAAAAAHKANQEHESREAALQAETIEERERSKRLLKQLEDLTAGIRALKRKDEERELAYKQQLAGDEDRIRDETGKNVAQEFELKGREKDKHLADALHQVEELKAKMQRGSQQAQGEVLELETEELLRHEFKDDEVTEVKKGQRGVDVVQKVSDRRGLLRNDPMGNEECPMDRDVASEASGRSAGSESTDRGPCCGPAVPWCRNLFIPGRCLDSATATRQGPRCSTALQLDPDLCRTRQLGGQR